MELMSRHKEIFTWHELLVFLIQASCIIGWLEGKMRAVTDEFTWRIAYTQICLAERIARDFIAKDAADLPRPQVRLRTSGAPRKMTPSVDGAGERDYVRPMPILAREKRLKRTSRARTPVLKAPCPYGGHMTELKETGPLIVRYERLQDLIKETAPHIHRYLRTAALREARREFAQQAREAEQLAALRRSLLLEMIEEQVEMGLLPPGTTPEELIVREPAFTEVWLN